MADFSILEQLRPKDLREYANRLVPGFLRRNWGERFIGAVAGLLSDVVIEGAYQAINVRSMRSPSFPYDGLDLMGSERMLPRFPAEPHTTYKERLLAAWAIWQQSGTDGGIVYLFSLLGFAVTVKRNYNWNWDGDAANWSRFWVIIDDHDWNTDGVWDDPGTWDDGGVWDSDATIDEVRAVRNIVHRHKPVMAICPAICVVFDPVAWAADQPDGTWKYLWDRNPAASYWDG